MKLSRIAKSLVFELSILVQSILMLNHSKSQNHTPVNWIQTESEQVEVQFSNGIVFKWFRIQMVLYSNGQFRPSKTSKHQNHLMIGHVLTISIPIVMVFRSPLYNDRT